MTAVEAVKRCDESLGACAWLVPTSRCDSPLPGVRGIAVPLSASALEVASLTCVESTRITQ